MLLTDVDDEFNAELETTYNKHNDPRVPVEGEDYRPRQRRRRHRRDHQLHQHLQPVRAGRRRPGRPQGAREGADAQAVGQDQPRAGQPGGHRLSRRKPACSEDLNALGFDLVGYGCTTCIGNSGPLAEPISKAINDNDLVARRVLSGNRNFEGRVSPDCRANYLASPPLVVAYALKGTVRADMVDEPIGTGQQRRAGLSQGHLADQRRDPPR